MSDGAGASPGPEGARILVVDDEIHLAEGLRDVLEGEGYRVAVAHDGAEGLEKALAESFDLVLLDVMMPKMNGLETCAALRREGSRVPVLFLTVKGSPEDRIRGLEVGGDDYLPKPFRLRELLLRVAAILRRTQGSGEPEATLAFGGNEVDFLSYQARAWDSREHVLTHKEAMILKVFAGREGAVVPREQLLDEVWGHEVYPSTRTIDNFIVRLRRRFERNPEAPEHFHTVRGVGYRFTREPEAAHG